MAKFLDENGLLYLWSKIKSAFVSKETGKGLSSNDYTTTEKNKLTGVATGAQVNVIESVKVNGTALSVANKAVDVTVPTLGSSDNASGYVTYQMVSNMEDDVRAALSTRPDADTVESMITEAIGDIAHFAFEIVNALPASGETNIIYLIAHAHGTNNSYDEYAYINNAWEMIGTTEVDLSNYMQKSDMAAIANSEIDTIVAQ